MVGDFGERLIQSLVHDYTNIQRPHMKIKILSLTIIEMSLMVKFLILSFVDGWALQGSH